MLGLATCALGLVVLQAAATGLPSPREPVRTAPPAQVTRPHIVYFLVDDLGFANVGYNNDEPLTPHIDALHDSGLELTNYYTYKYCSPTRSAFHSGRLPIHVNQENHPPTSPGGGVPVGMTTITDKLNASGYRNHQIGKWHCGMSAYDQLPVNRGYHSSFGYLSGAEDHYANTRTCNHFAGVDLWRSHKAAIGENGTLEDSGYNTFKFTAEALRVVHGHTAPSLPPAPLFLYLAYANVHGPLQVPSNYTDLYNSSGAARHVTWRPRLMCLGMIAAVDESIGQVVAALRQERLWEDTLVIFSSDNGGPADHANNWPLRGHKANDFDGGVRVCAFLHGGYLARASKLPPGSKILGMMHIADWWATLATLVGQSTADPRAAAAGLPAPDSLDMWAMISGANATSPRAELVLSGTPSTSTDGNATHAGMIITMVLPGAAVASRMKLVTGSQGGYFGGMHAPNATAAVELPYCDEGCLFNLDTDPTEHHDLAADVRYAGTLASLQAKLRAAIGTYYQSPGSEAADEAAVAVARKRGGFWGPWLPDGPYSPPPPPPPAPVPTAGFTLTRKDVTPAGCLTTRGLAKTSIAVYGECDYASHWEEDAEGASGGLYNVGARDKADAWLRESPKEACAAGNTAQLGVGKNGKLVTVFDAANGVLRETGCKDMCLGIAPVPSPAAAAGGADHGEGETAVVLMSCSAPGAKGWVKETFGHRADPMEIFS